MTLKLIERDENAPKPLTGAEVLVLVADLIDTHLPTIPFDDPYRGSLSALACCGPRRRVR